MTIASPPPSSSVLERAESQPPEVLAVDDVVATLGFFPARSLALRIRRRRRPFAVLRVDLPRASPAPPGPAGASAASSASGADEGALRVSQVLTGLLSKLTGVAGVDLLVFRDPPEAPPSPRRDGRGAIAARTDVADGTHAPDGTDAPDGTNAPDGANSPDGTDELLDLLAVRLDDAGFSIGLLVVVDGGAASRRIRYGRWSPPAPLTREALSRSVHTPLPTSSGRGPGGAPPVPGGQPDVVAGRAAEARRAGKPHSSTGAEGPGLRHGAEADVHHGAFVPLCPIPAERRTAALAALGLHPGHGAAEAPGELLRALQSWVTALQGPGLPGETLSIALAWPLRSTAVRDLVLMLAAWGVESAIDALHEITESRPGDGKSVFSAFLGAGDRAPRDEGLRRSVEVLRRVAECAPVALVPAPLAMLAWLEWSRGRGTVAAAYLDECLRADPAYTLGLLFRQVLDQGWVPEWID